jgi:toxin ParE1/3/4
MKRRIIRTDASRADLVEILSFISQDNPRAARDLLRKFNDRLELLSDFPGAGAARPELRRGLRSFPVGNYLLFYSVTRTTLVLERVLHGARNLRRIFRRW